MTSERKGPAGELRYAGKRWTLRVRVAGERRTFALETCRDPNRRDQAEKRARFVGSLLEAFDRASKLGTDDAEKLLGMACTDPDGMLPAIRSVAEKLIDGKLPEADGSAPRCMTFRDLAEQWTSGRLHREHPDHVRAKDSKDDSARFKYLNALDVGGVKLGDVPLDRFTLEHAERAMRQLPEAAKRPATRRHYGQGIYRLLALAVYPCRIIATNPLPRGFLPKQGKPPAFACLYPAEDAQLLACREVPLVRRMLYGVLAREGLRLGEAVALRWCDLDLERGVLTLDANKTHDPRAWALGDDVVLALRAWRKRTCGKADELAGEQVFSERSVPVEIDGLAELFRETDLHAAGVTRHELFARTAQRRPVRVHDLRATFITLALSVGRSETWVADRTGHRSSQMINRYRRAARGASELGLGWLTPLDRAMPELADDVAPNLPVPLGRPRSRTRRRAFRGAELPHSCPTGSGSTGIRTLDRRIKNPQL